MVGAAEIVRIDRLALAVDDDRAFPGEANRHGSDAADEVAPGEVVTAGVACRTPGGLRRSDGLADAALVAQGDDDARNVIVADPRYTGSSLRHGTMGSLAAPVDPVAATP